MDGLNVKCVSAWETLIQLHSHTLEMHMCVQSSCGNKLKCVVCVPAHTPLVATHTLKQNILIETPQLYTLYSGLVTSSASSLTRTNYSNPITSSLGWDHLISLHHSGIQQHERNLVLLIQ